MPAGLSCSQEKSAVYSRFLKVLLSSKSICYFNMFESEESDSSVVRKSMSEDDEWEKEEVVLTSSTDPKPAVNATLNSLSCQDFGLGELAYADEPLADDEYIQEHNREVDKRAELQQTLENRLNQGE